MAARHPEQVKLQAYLDYVAWAVSSRLNEIDGPVAMSLDVGLPSTTDFMNGYDLDNYLWPLARRFRKGGCQIVSAWATKRIAD
jgi:hypothetical protein